MKTIQNPILRGFCPDPCMIRTGDDYYIATSTFEWWPCVNLYHSKDLAHWEQLPSPLREPGQMDLRGDPNSGGIWAPDLSWDGQYYYLLVTNVTTKKGRWYNTHNYMSRAASITGPWSQPVYLNSIGFDPSLLHDTDGKCYLVNMVNGFKGVLVQQMDPETGACWANAARYTALRHRLHRRSPHLSHWQLVLSSCGRRWYWVFPLCHDCAVGQRVRPL